MSHIQHQHPDALADEKMEEHTGRTVFPQQQQNAAHSYCRFVMNLRQILHFFLDENTDMSKYLLI